MRTLERRARRLRLCGRPLGEWARSATLQEVPWGNARTRRTDRAMHIPSTIEPEPPLAYFRNHRYKGVCRNRLTIRRDRLEDQLLNALETRILRPDMTAYLVTRFEEQLRARLKQMAHGDYASGRVAMERKREELRTQAKRISAAIGHGGNLESLLDHLKGLESEIAALSRQ